jgi:chromatin segregation and condensation protein Rec8/ScpA/Scc1 (kleisin family)
VAILELMREGLIDIVQTEAYAPLHVRAAPPHPQLRVVSNEAAAEPAVAAGADDEPVLRSEDEDEA